MGGDQVHVLASAESDDGGLVFYRLDFLEPPRGSRRRKPVEFVSSAVMEHEDCSEWLENLALAWRAERDKRQLLVLARPCGIRPGRIRMAWIGPEILAGRDMVARMEAIGQVHGAEITHIAPRSYRDVEIRLGQIVALDTVVICRRYAPFITTDTVPDDIDRNFRFGSQQPHTIHPFRDPEHHFPFGAGPQARHRVRMAQPKFQNC